MYKFFAILLPYVIVNYGVLHAAAEPVALTAYTAMEVAAKNGDANLAITLLSNQSSFARWALMGHADPLGFTPLHTAILAGTKNVVIEFLRFPEVPINKPDSKGLTPLHWAVISSHKSIARLLLVRGANVDAQDNDGWSPLQWAQGTGRPAIAQLLTEWKKLLLVKQMLRPCQRR
jgi:ankyrin repeat protein